MARKMSLHIASSSCQHMRQNNFTTAALEALACCWATHLQLGLGAALLSDRLQILGCEALRHDLGQGDGRLDSQRIEEARRPCRIQIRKQVQQAALLIYDVNWGHVHQQHAWACCPESRLMVIELKKRLQGTPSLSSMLEQRTAAADQLSPTSWQASILAEFNCKTRNK